MKLKNRNAFTVNELLVTMVLLAILSAMAYSNYVDFKSDAQFKVVEKFAVDMFTAIGMKDLYVQMECNALKVSLEDIQNNDVTTSTCLPSAVPVAQRRFVNMHPEDYPTNPRTNKSDITQCACINPCDTACFSVNAGYCLHPIARTFFAIQIGCRGEGSSSSSGSSSSGDSSDGTDADTGSGGSAAGVAGDSGTDGGAAGGTGGTGGSSGADGDADGGSGTADGGDGGSSGGGSVTDGEDVCE